MIKTGYFKGGENEYPIIVEILPDEPRVVAIAPSEQVAEDNSIMIGKLLTAGFPIEASILGNQTVLRIAGLAISYIPTEALDFYRAGLGHHLVVTTELLN